MKPNFNIFLTSITCLLFFITFQEGALAQDKSEVIYQCAPCGCSSDGKHFDKPGACSSCGMKLVAGTEPFNYLKDLDKPMNVAILLFNHAQVLDYAGPMMYLLQQEGKTLMSIQLPQPKKQLQQCLT